LKFDRFCCAFFASSKDSKSPYIVDPLPDIKENTALLRYNSSFISDKTGCNLKTDDSKSLVSFFILSGLIIKSVIIFLKSYCELKVSVRLSDEYASGVDTWIPGKTNSI
jgi:hypothetical protein